MVCGSRTSLLTDQRCGVWVIHFSVDRSTYITNTFQYTGEPLLKSSNDNEKDVKERVTNWYTKMNPLLDYYKSNGLLARVHAQQPTEYVKIAVEEHFDQSMPRKS